MLGYFRLDERRERVDHRHDVIGVERRVEHVRSGKNEPPPFRVVLEQRAEYHRRPRRVPVSAVRCGDPRDHVGIDPRIRPSAERSVEVLDHPSPSPIGTDRCVRVERLACAPECVVLPRPVGIREVALGDHVLEVIGDVDPRRGDGEIRLVAQVVRREPLEERGVIERIARVDFEMRGNTAPGLLADEFEHVDVVPVDVVVRRGVVFVEPLPDVHDSPVFAVDEENGGSRRLDVGSITADRALKRCVEEIRRAVVVAARAQDQPLEPGHVGTGKQRVLEPLRAVVITGVKAECLVRDVAREVAVHADSGILRDTEAAIVVEELHVRRTFPRDAVLRVVRRAPVVSVVTVARHEYTGRAAEQVRRV